MTTPRISVVIPVKNEIAKIRACIEGIVSQSIAPMEIIVLDSGSTDGTLDVLAEYDIVRVIAVSPDDFNHGETRNVGVRAASGEFVALTVGDAIPCDNDWLRHLHAGFTDDQVAGVCGRQVVESTEENNPLDWYRPQSTPAAHRVQFDSADEFHALSPEEKRRACGWDDVTAMYRRDRLLETPFQETTYAEDAIWAAAALTQGWALVYEPKAQVYHYHLELPEFAYKRTLTVLYHMHELFDFLPGAPNRLAGYWEAMKILPRERTLSLPRRFEWLWFNLRANKARTVAVCDFLEANHIGPEAVKALHERHCSRPPVPPKVDQKRQVQ